MNVVYLGVILDAFSFTDRTCIYDSSGSRYTGTLNTTKNGHTCLRWNDSRVLPKIDPTTEFPEMDMPENYCRNPKQRGGSHTTWGPWCYIALVTGIGFEDCNLMRCRKKPLKSDLHMALFCIYLPSVKIWSQVFVCFSFSNLNKFT